MPENETPGRPVGKAPERLPWPPFDPAAPLHAGWAGSVLERFKSHVRRQPEAIAATAGAEILTYAGLDAASDRLAEQILSRAVGSKQMVSIVGGRHPRLVIALMGAIKAGFAFHVIDPKYPPRRIADYLSYVSPAGILNAARRPEEAESALQFHQPAGPCFRIEVAAGKRSATGPATVGRCSVPDLQPDSPMYVAFTSGTTGTPKAVWGAHGPVSHFFDWQCQTFGITAADRVSVLSGLAHDPLLRDVLMPLWAGGRSCFPPDEVYQVPGALHDWLRQEQVSIVHLTPSLCHLLLNIPQAATPPGLPQVRAAFFGGETLTARLALRFRALAPNATVVNCYGATETPQVMAVHVLNGMSSAQDEPDAVPIGRGIEGVQLLLLADGNHLCGVGETGEVCIRTPHRAARIEDISGRPSGNMIANPFSSDPDDLLYRSGDYGRYLSDGAVLFEGRRDRQVKIRGFRVDLCEIERAVEKCPGLAGYFVDAETRGEDGELALFVMPDGADSFQVGRLRDQLREWLPPFMVPDRIIALPSLPRTPNGKTDRERLRMILKESADVKGEAIICPGPEASTPELASISQRLRALSLADESDNLRSMDSLRLVEVACLLENEFGVRLPVGNLQSCQTLSALAEKINQLLGGAAFFERLPASGPVFSSGPLPAEMARVMGEDQGRRRNPPLFPPNERLDRAIVNRLLQIVARVAPDALRVRLHRWRGVQLGNDISIGYDTILETAFPWLVRIGHHTNIGMRVTVIGHFRGMEHAAGDGPTVVIDDYAFVGPGVIILPNVKIGKGAVVAAGSVVSTSIPDFCFAQGNPARVVAKCGVPLSGSASYAEFLSRLVPLSAGVGTSASVVSAPKRPD